MIKSARCSLHAAGAALLLAIILSCPLLLSSCGREERKPPPIITIVILDKWDSYLLDGQRVDRDTLEIRLQRMATQYMREITGTSRAYVRITSQNKQKSQRSEKDSLMRYCMGIGLDKIQFH